MAEHEGIWSEYRPTYWDGWSAVKRVGDLVRCRDCKYYDEIIHACNHPCVTPLRGDCPENWIFTCFDNDFCCWGKRKVVDA